jgi:excinuclease ABC subunit C
MIPSSVRIQGNTLPDAPGVYVMKGERGNVLYVGKATSLKRRVTSYFQKAHPSGNLGTGDARIEEMVSKIRKIDYIEKSTVIEALILEANLIKYHWPPYNIREKDNKSFLYLVITKEEFPRPLLVRGHELSERASRDYRAVFGPYTSPRSLRAALDLLRRVFPWTTCVPGRKRPCFYYHLKQCPGVCIGVADKKAYGRVIRDLMRFFEGKKEGIITAYRRDMKKASREKRFEDAAALRNKIHFLEHIQDVAVLKHEDADVDTIRTGEADVNLFGRIEGYDISHISGTSTVASMVVFENGAPAKPEYRTFRIKSVVGADDYAAIRETLTRRFRNAWRHPDLLLIDGGMGQVHVALATLHELNIAIPVVGMVKGPDRKRMDLVCDPRHQHICKACQPYQNLLAQVRDEAHRFAITYHRKVRSSGFRVRG